MKVNYTEPYPFRPIPTITVANDYWENKKWRFNVPEITVGAGATPQPIDVTVKGIGAVTLVNAIDDGLLSLTLFGGTEQLPEQYLDTVVLSGGCEQSGTPTPTTPIDIVCNNGAIKVRHKSGLPLEYQAVEYLESSGTQYIDIGVYISTGYKVRVKAYATSISGTIAFFGCTTTADSADAKKGIYRIIGSSINRCAWGNGRGSVVSNLTGNDSINTWYDMVCDNGVWTINDTLFVTCPESSFTSEYSMWLFARNTGGAVGLPASCRISVCQIWDNNGQMIQNLVPCKNVSNVLGMYDTVTGTFLTNQGTGDFTAGQDIDDIEIYTDGTIEQVADSVGNTASAERLLAVGDYKDTQEVLTGSVTRNVGIKVLDGTEDWKKSSNRPNAFVSEVTNFPNILVRQLMPCTHFIGTTDASDLDNDNYIFAGTAVNISINASIANDSTSFANWLASQYANGTPVIVVYPLATATTESVTSQLLQKSPVTQTAGSISNLPIAITESSHTTPTPQQPLDINCNNGVVKLSPNLFNKNNVQVNKNWNNDNMAYSIASSYIPAKKGDAFTLSISDMPKYTYTTWVVLDSNYAYIGTTSSGSAITQDNCAYIRLSIRCANTDSWTQSDLDNAKIQLEQGSTATPYHPYGQIYVDGTTETVGIKDGNNLLPNNAQPDVLYPIYLSTAQRIVASANVNNGSRLSACEVRYYNGNKQMIDYYTMTLYSDGRMYKDPFVVPSNTKYVSIFRKSDYATTPVTELKVEIGNTMTPYFNGGSATAEMLLKVGDYQDIQSVLDGKVTRKVGVKVLDGTETITKQTNASAPLGYYFGVESSNINHIADTRLAKSSHFVAVTNNAGSLIDGSIAFASSTKKIWIATSLATTEVEFKQWLSDQYANGTPVIIVYPLATATTETVTAQPLTIQEGTNIVEITQASMDNLELEVSYKAGVTVTVTEIENAQLDNSVEVTING